MSSGYNANVHAGRIVRALIAILAIGLCALIFMTYSSPDEVESASVPPALRGRVVDENGAPLEAKLFLRKRTERYAETLKAKTDRDGRYAFLRVEAGAWNLHALAPHFMTRTVSLDKIAGSELDIDFVLSPGGSIRGRVEGATPGGWTITAHANSTDDFETELWRRMVTGKFVSDADGSFVVDGLADGEYALQLVSPDVRFAAPEKVIARSGDTNVVLHARASGELRVRVRFEGAPAPETFTAGLITETPQTFTSQPGIFTVKLPFGEHLPIVVRADGFVTRTVGARIDEGATGELEVTLQASARLRGRVVARDGAPIAGAEVVALPDGGRSRGNLYDAPRANTDDEGRFLLDGLAPGEVVLGVWARGYGYEHATSHTDPIGLRDPFSAKQRERAIEIRLAPGASVAGRVTLTGKPLIHELIHLEPEGLPPNLVDAYWIRIPVHTDGAGRFELTDVKPDRYTLSIRTAPQREEVGVSRSLAITVPESGIANLELELADGSQSLALILPPLDGFWMVELAADPCRSLRAPCRAYSRIAKGGTRAVFDSLPAGDYRVTLAEMNGPATNARERSVKLRQGEGPIELDLD